VPIVRDRLRVIGGARWEHDLIELDTAVRAGPDTPCPDNETQCDAVITRDESNILPGVSLIYSPLYAMNLRFAWNKTVSRPEFRELAPTEFPAQRGERPSFGNILLVQSEWESYDVRWEWLYGEDELVSMTGFYKEGENPIEKTEVPQAADPAETWINAATTKIWGLEFEGRKDLGSLHEKLEGFRMSTNVSWFPKKETFVPKVQVANLDTQQTNTNRDPVDVPNFIVNATLEYSIEDLVTAQVLYQTVGPTIVRAGVFGVPDATSERADRVDIVLQFPLERWIDLPVNLNLSAENITNDQFIETQGDFITKTTTAGVKFGLGLSYTY
jgi:outer membrane receptor protein involved in Fe transport